MRTYENVMIKAFTIVECRCSICGRDLLVDDEEGTESFHLFKAGGYWSIFGDGTTIEIDLCQHCFREKLGEYCTIRLEGE